MHPTSTPVEPQRPALPPARLRQTLRRALQAWWDALGFVCAISLTLFVVACVPAVVAFGARPSTLRPALWLVALALFVALVPPLYAGACCLVHRIYAHEEPAYGDMWRGFARMYRQSLALGAVQSIVTAVLAANVAFYLTRRGFLFVALAACFAYLLLFWLLNVFYHWPVLAAGDAGVIRRDDGGRPGLKAVLRNGLVLALSAPGYAFVLVALLAAVEAALLVTGVGMALLGGGLAAFVMTQATRDHLVRYGLLDPPDEGGPVPDTWKVE